MRRCKGVRIACLLSPESLRYKLAHIRSHLIMYTCPTGSPPSAIFEECVSPLVDGLFQGYNATVLAYGQKWVVLKVLVDCEGCRKKVTKILHNISGVESCDVDIKKQRVVVEVTGNNVDADTLISKLVKKTGKHAELWPEPKTGSGKTYTMGTVFKDVCQTGAVPHVMTALFGKIEFLKHQIDLQVHVSYIEILEEEVLDWLDSTSKMESGNAKVGKITTPGKLPPIHIRKTSSGVITLTGCTEVNVCTLQEMAGCLEQGSLSLATGSTNMNNQSRICEGILVLIRDFFIILQEFIKLLRNCIE